MHSHRPTPLPVSLLVPLLLAALLPGVPPPGTLPPSSARPASGTPPALTGVRASAAPWVWPTGSRVVVRPWEAPADTYGPGHRGIDVAAPLGAPAVAVADGTVAFAGQVAGRGVVTVDHGSGLVSTLDSVAPLVRAGTMVAQGDPVGTVAIGHCPATAPCVHLGARRDERYVDPLPLLPRAAWPVLLPEDAWAE